MDSIHFSLPLSLQTRRRLTQVLEEQESEDRVDEELSEKKINFDVSDVNWNDDGQYDTLLPIWQLKSTDDSAFLRDVTKFADNLPDNCWDDLNNQPDDHRKVVVSSTTIPTQPTDSYPTTPNHTTPNDTTPHPHRQYSNQVHYLEKHGVDHEERRLYRQALQYGRDALSFCGLQDTVKMPSLIAVEQGAREQGVHQDATGVVGATPAKWSVFVALHNREIDFAVKDEKELKSITMVGGDTLVFDARLAFSLVNT